MLSKWGLVKLVRCGGLVAIRQEGIRDWVLDWLITVDWVATIIRASILELGSGTLRCLVVLASRRLSKMV